MILSVRYEVDMTNLCLILQGFEHQISIKAADVEEDTKDGSLIAKNSQGKIIGKFPLDKVTGWWVQE